MPPAAASHTGRRATRMSFYREPARRGPWGDGTSPEWARRRAQSMRAPRRGSMRRRGKVRRPSDPSHRRIPAARARRFPTRDAERAHRRRQSHTTPEDATRVPAARASRNESRAPDCTPWDAPSDQVAPARGQRRTVHLQGTRAHTHRRTGRRLVHARPRRPPAGPPAAAMRGRAEARQQTATSTGSRTGVWDPAVSVSTGRTPSTGARKPGLRRASCRFRVRALVWAGRAPHGRLP
jgi:hypothetical protein